MNAIDKFRIAPNLYTLPEIETYYNCSRKSIDCMYSSSDNRKYAEQFFGRSEAEVQEEANRIRKELSHVCSMCVMAYIESLFRIDSFVRIKHKCKGNITGKVKALLQKKKSIPLVRFEDLLDVWKEEYETETLLFRAINNSLKFRHWIAHGRYWRLDNDIDLHFDFVDIFLLAQQVESALGNELRTQDGIGEARRLHP